MTEVDEARQALEDAIALLREHGWTKGQEYNSVLDAYCLYGALRQVTKGKHASTYQLPAALNWAVRALATAIHRRCVQMRYHGDNAVDTITGWNDRHARDTDEAIEMLKLAEDELGVNGAGH